MAKQEVVTQQVNPTDIAIDNKFIDSISKQLTKKQEYGLSFPPNYNVTNALNSAYLMLQDQVIKKNTGGKWVENKVLDVCSKQSIASCLIDMTVQGLSPNKKQCYFVPCGNKLTLMRSYQGTMAIIKRLGVKKTPVAQIIYEGDTFEYHIENGRYVIDKHIQDFMNIDNGKIKGAYAVLETEGELFIEIMNINQIKKAWAMSKNYNETDEKDVHNKFADQMCKKTVINRACKNFINSSDDGYLAESFDETTDNENIDIAAENVEYETSTNANAVNFEEVVQENENDEVLQGEVIDTKDTEKPNDKPKSKVSDDNPDWLSK